MRYPLAERFHAPQGEGLFTGAQMAFVRLVGCSVGKRTCTVCDTDFEAVNQALGGGKFTPDEIVQWAGTARHVCITGGEPLDRDIRELIYALAGAGLHVHVETSGTILPAWLDPGLVLPELGPGRHIVVDENGAGINMRLWITVSPKPGWREEMIARADEIKWIVGGLGDGPGWPTLDDAKAWAARGHVVYAQPRNERDQVSSVALSEALATTAAHPELRLSPQVHKFLRTR